MPIRTKLKRRRKLEEPMKKKRCLISFVLLLSAVFVFTGHVMPVNSAETFFVPVMPEPELSADGRTLYNASAIGVVVNDPNPAPNQVQIPAPDNLTDPSTATSTFQFTYQTAGQKDPWGETCYDVPDSTKAGFNYAGAIWGNLLQSSVPIKIQVCWGSLTGSTLGYSGGGPSHKDFPNAPRAATWYSGSLANSLAGADQKTDSYDMYITYNKNFSWYTGTDANPPADKHDLVTVALHEICHGLNFSGYMSYSSGVAKWGYGGYPNIYDTFMRDGSGNSIIDTSVYANNSAALGTAVTSNNLWFHGAQAMSANGGSRVKMYAPTTWTSGSSYSHLDYDTFASGSNRLMRYAISSGVAIHDPGPVTMGLLKDLGWKTGGTTSASAQVMSLLAPSNASPGGTITLSAQVKNTGSSALPTGAAVYYYVYGPNYSNWIGGTYVAGLGAGSSQWYPCNWTIPSSTTPGTYTYWAIVYDTSKPISDWSNAQTFTISAGTQSSAQVISLLAPGNASPGETISLSAQVKNTGGSALPNGSGVYYYVYGPNYSNWAGGAYVAGLGAGASKWYTINWTIPSSTTPGTYTYWAIVYDTSKPISDWSSGQAFTVSGSTGISPKPGLWNGSNIKFNVSSDGKKLTNTGSSIVYNGSLYSTALGPITFYNVGQCAKVNLTLYLSGDLPITNNSFVYSSSDGKSAINGNFSSSSYSTGNYSINSVYVSDCAGYLTGSGSWSATPVSAASILDSSLGQEGISGSDLVVVYEILPE